MLLRRGQTIHAVLPWLIGVLAVCLYLAPLWTAPPHSIPAHYPDGGVFTWNFWWAKQALSTGRPLFENVPIFHPFGAELYLHTFTTGLTYPLTWAGRAVSPTGLFTLAVLVCFTANFACAYFLFARASESWAWGLFAASVVSFHPFVTGHLDGGHLNFLALFPFFILLNSLVYLGLVPRAGDPARLVAVCAAMLALGCLSQLNPYYVYDAFLLLGIFWMCFLRKSGRLARDCAVMASGGALLSLISFWPMARAAWSGAFTADHAPERHSADLLSLLLPGANQLIGRYWPFPELLAGVRVNSAESGVYIGISLLLLLAWTVCVKSVEPAAEERRRLEAAFFLSGISFLSLSLGPRLQAGGAALLPLPFYSAGAALLPFFPSVPVRFAYVGILLLWLFTALRLSTRRPPALLSGVVILTALIEFAPAPPQTSVLAPTPVLESLRRLENISAIHDAGAGQEERLVRQMYHHKAVTGGFLARRPRHPALFYKRNKFLRYLEARGSKAPAASEIQAGWDALRIQGVLIEASSTAEVARLRGLSWLVEALRDDRWMFFSSVSLSPDLHSEHAGISANSETSWSPRP